MQQPAATTAGGADQGDPTWRPVPDGSAQLVADGGQFAASTDQRAVVPVGTGAYRADGVPDRHRRHPAGDRHRRQLTLGDQAGGGAGGGCAERDGAGRGVLLQSGRGGDHGAAGHAVPAGDDVAQVDHDLAGGDTDPDAQPDAVDHGPPVQRGLDLEAGAHRPVRVEAVGVPSAEERHHGVADVLLHHPLPAVQHAGDGVEVGPLQRSDVLRVEPVHQGRGADDVREEDSDDAPLLRYRPERGDDPLRVDDDAGGHGCRTGLSPRCCLITSGDWHSSADGGSAERRMSATCNL